MGRDLRPRKSRPSYATMLGSDSERESGREQAPGLQDNVESGDEFVPAATSQNETNHAEGSSMPTDSLVQQKGKARSVNPAETTAPPSVQRVSRPSTRKMYQLPTPSVHHRHRAVPLFTHIRRVERLVAPPQTFAPAKTVPTNDFTHDPAIKDRITKAWGYNVGPGPLWELVEDRSWFKESQPEGSEVDQEAYHRPIVHERVCVKAGWQILHAEDASSYLPTDGPVMDQCSVKPPSPVVCSLGPFGKQTRLQMCMFEARKISEFIPGSRSHVFCAGAPVWGLDWCPIHPSDRPKRDYAQYLAVAPFPYSSYSPAVGSKSPRPFKSCVQIWTLRPSSPLGQEGEPDVGRMKCEMVLCLEGGPAHDVKWCPLPSHDPFDETSGRITPGKLGVIALTCQDGSLSVYVVPEPKDVTPQGHDASLPVFVRLAGPTVRIELEETACWTVDWANSEVIAVGTTSGIIAVYNITQALQGSGAESQSAEAATDVLPTHYITVHQSAIRALAWIRVPPFSSEGSSYQGQDPTVIASGGYDGVECLTDIREGCGHILNRTRDVITSMTFSPFTGGPITIDHENMVKAYSASPSMLGRGHYLLEPKGPVWSINASDHHPQLAVGSSDGSCSTTNTLRSTRRGGSVPFFVHKIYQLDYSRKLGEFRMLEQFLPQESQEKGGPAVAKNKTKERAQATPDPLGAGTGAWPHQVGVHRVVWNDRNGLAAAGMLASATGSGLCRVDWLWGRWINGKIPYGSIVNMRKDANAGDMDLDSSLSDVE